MPAPSPLHLTAPFVRLAEDRAAEVLATSHGLVVEQIDRLQTERDDTFRVLTGRGSFVAKFAHPLDDGGVLGEQVAVLDALAHAHALLPVQRVLPALDGALLTSIDDGAGHQRLLRVLTFLDGEPLGAAPRSLTAIRALGALHADLAAAIAAIGEAAHPPLQGAPTPWNLLAVEQYGPLADELHDATLRREVEHVIDRAQDAVLSRAYALPALLAHNDLHGDNVLVRAEPFAITGVLDFGDMTRTPRVADLAVAASYARGRVGEEREPWVAARAYVAGFESQQPLTPEEHALLPELVLLRLAQRAILNSAIAAANPAATPYASRNLGAIARDVRELGSSIPSTIGASP